MSSHESPDLVDLFTTYTAHPDSIGSQLTRTATEHGTDDPLIVATGADLALYPGGGRAPMVEGFRFSTRGFKELAGISHLGPALATIVQMRALYGDRSWREAATRLLTQVEHARSVNGLAVWRDTVAVDAYRGREQAIANMADYTFAVTARYLRAALADEQYLNADTLRRNYLEGGNRSDLRVPINRVMIATFFLTAMDISFRVLRWFREQQIDWSRAMVVIAGKQGRPTAGVTWNTSSVATMILGASKYQLSLDRMYIAPHAPVFTSPVDGDLTEVAALEKPLRRIWFNTRATVELGELMFPDYPKYAPHRTEAFDVNDPAITEVSEMPAIHGPDDWRALYTRLRIVLEDPRQLLSGCVTDYAVSQLIATDNDPQKVVVPGLDGIDYPIGLDVPARDLAT